MSRRQRFVACVFGVAAVAFLSSQRLSPLGIEWYFFYSSFLGASWIVPIPSLWQYFLPTQYGFLLLITAFALYGGAKWSWLFARATTSILLFQVVCIFFYHHYSSITSIIRGVMSRTFPRDYFHYLNIEEKIGLYVLGGVALLLFVLSWLRLGRLAIPLEEVQQRPPASRIALLLFLGVVAIVHLSEYMNAGFMILRMAGGLLQTDFGVVALNGFGLVVLLPIILFVLSITGFLLADTQRNRGAHSFLVLAIGCYFSYMVLLWGARAWAGIELEDSLVLTSNLSITSFPMGLQDVWSQFIERHWIVFSGTAIASIYVVLENSTGRNGRRMGNG